MTDDKAMTGPSITLLQPPQARDIAEEVAELYAEVYAEPPYNEGPDDVAAFTDRYRQQTQQPGFALAAAYDGHRLVGMAYVATLEAGRWWRGALDTPPPDIHAADKAGLYELAIRRPHRGRGLARQLVHTALAHRPEAWAVLLVNPDTTAHTIYQHWGWQPAGLVQPQPGWPVNQAMTHSLPIR